MTGRVVSRSLLLAAVACVLCYGLAFADRGAVSKLTPAKKSPASEADHPLVRPEQIAAPAQPKSVPDPGAQDVSADLDALFYHAMKLVYAERFAEASGKLKELAEHAALAGFSSASDFSLKLLERATLSISAHRTSEAVYLVNKAVDLSPEDPRIRLVAASFYRTIGRFKAVSHLLSFIQYMPKYPVLLSAVLFNLFFVLLVACTASCFVGCIFQFLRGGELLFETIGKMMPLKVRGFLTPICFLGVLVLPLFGGILFALGSWSLVLTRCRQNCCLLAIFCGALISAWGLALPRLSSLAAHVQLEQNRLLEDVIVGNFMAGSEHMLSVQIQGNPHDPLLLYAMAQMFQLRRQWAEAESMYMRALLAGDASSNLQQAIQINLSAVLYELERYEEAQRVLEKELETGHESFEVYYNLALTKLALTATESYRQLYARAQDFDGARLRSLEKQLGEQMRPVLARLPAGVLLRRLFQPAASLDEYSQRQLYRKQGILAATLFTGRGPVGIGILGLIFILLSFIARKCHVRDVKAVSRIRVLEKEDEQRVPALAWSVLPAGGFLIGRYPMMGVAMLAVLLAMLMAACGRPFGLYFLIPYDLAFERALIIAVVILYSSVTLYSIVRGGMQRYAK